MMFNCLIIDDNQFIIEVLSDLLNDYHPEIKLIGTANNGEEGKRLIEEKKPDLIFLDVEMPDMSGFQMLSKLSEIAFQTIFITAHSHYAIKAIRFNALDYLMKPIDPEELSSAIDRYKENQNNYTNQEGIQIALKNLSKEKPEEQILRLHTQEGTKKILLQDIIKIDGERNYSYICTSNRGKILASKTLAYFEEILSNKGFFRSHRSCLVNRKHIVSIKSNDTFVLTHNESASISRRKKKEAREWFEDTL